MRDEKWRGRDIRHDIRPEGDGHHRVGGELSDLPTGELLREFFTEGQHVLDNTRKLVREEVEVATAELRREIRDTKEKATKAGAAFGAAGLFGHTAFLALTAFAVIALAYAMPLWLSALIVTVVWAAVGAGAFFYGKKRIKEIDVKPDRVIGNFKEDGRWAKETMQSIRSKPQASA